jgi:hypothetical protein
MTAFAPGPAWPPAEASDLSVRLAADEAEQQQQITRIHAQTLRVVRTSTELRRAAANARQHTAEIHAAIQRRAAGRPDVPERGSALR